MKEQKKCVPEIRFAGFTDDWEQRKLGEISDKVIDKNIKVIYSETFTNSAEFGVISQRDFFDKDISNSDNLSNYYVVQNNDFIYNPRISNFAPVGPIRRNKLGRTGVMSPLYYVFRVRDVQYEFLDAFFETDKWHSFMKLYGDMGARADRISIKDSIFAGMPLMLPSLEEQTAIGNFFKQLDDTIALHQRTLEKYQKLKISYLEKMFPKENEQFPELRFPNFTDAWEQRKLGDIAKFLNGRAYKQNELLTKGKYPVLRVGNFNTNDRWYFSDLELAPKFYADKGDLLYTWATIFSPHIWSGSKVIYHYHIWKIELSEQFDKLFILQLLKADKSLTNNTNGSTMVHITKLEIEKKLVKFPPLDEQKKIGLFFKQLDDTIALHQREVEKYKKIKQAYLEKMFI